jgi:hypothetical protein
MNWVWLRFGDLDIDNLRRPAPAQPRFILGKAVSRRRWPTQSAPRRDDVAIACAWSIGVGPLAIGQRVTAPEVRWQAGPALMRRGAALPWHLLRLAASAHTRLQRFYSWIFARLNISNGIPHLEMLWRPT